MNKQLLATAVAAAMLAPAFASADVKVYGRVQAEYNIEDRDDADSVQGIDDTGGQSRIGFKFSEKLGGGLTAFGKAEFRMDPAQSDSGGTNGDGSDGAVSGALGQRDIHVGIKGSWGSIAAGSFNAPYKTAGGVKWDPWTATHLQARRAGGMTGGTGVGGHNGFMRNAIYYTSPNVNGFQVQFAISPDETNPGGPENGEDGDNDYSLAVQYKNGPWHAIVAHNRNNNTDTAGTAAITGTVTAVGTAVCVTTNGTTPGTAQCLTFSTGTIPATAGSSVDDETLTKVGLRWKSGAWTLAGQYEWISDADRSATGSATGGGAYRPASGGDADVFWLNAQYKMGNNIFTGSYGQTDVDPDGTASDYEFDYWAVGVIHKFSKKTRIFGGYTETDGDDVQPDRDAWTVGIRADF